MDKILITGAGGLVGYAIRQLDLPGAVYITHKDIDLKDFQQTRSLFDKIKPDCVIHLAARVGGIGGNEKHPGTFFRDNIMIDINVLESARLCRVKKLLSFMSTCVFPDKAAYPLNEKYLHDGPPHPSNFGYAYAKRMLEVQSRAYRKEWGCNYVVIIPTNIYGPNDNWNLESSHVIPALIHKCYLAKQNNTPFVVWGSGVSLREFIYSYDIAKFSLWALEYYNEGAPIIFSSGIEISIKSAVEIIAKAMGFSGEIIFDNSQPDGQFRKPTDNSKLKKYLPELRFTPIEEGIRDTVRWFCQNYPNIRL